jgi:hypothetical protein
MFIIITLTSILGLTILAWSVKRFFPFPICPICVGVSLTWLWMLIGQWIDKLSMVDYQLPMAMLMGGTVVGGMSKLEKLIEPKFVLVWKTVFVTSGFLAMYSLVTGHWLILTVGIIVAGFATLASKLEKIEKHKKESEEIKGLKDKMKNCC